MAEFIGGIQIPTYNLTGTFPLVTNFPWTQVLDRKVAVHRFPMGDGRIEQRFLLGSPSPIYSFRKNTLCPDERNALVNFWEANQGVLNEFVYPVPNEDGTFTEQPVRFKDQTLTLDGVIGSILTSGVEFVDTNIRFANPSTYTFSIAGTDVRYPGFVLSAALLQPIQELIPVIKITPRKAGYNAIYLSDRRVILDSQLYQPRILKRSAIQLGINGNVSPVTFTLGNADDVFTQLANDVNLYRADVEFSLFDKRHSNILLKYWKGYIVDWEGNESPEFTISCAEGIYELTLAYPVRKINRQCQRIFKNAGSGCPYGQVIPITGGARYQPPFTGFVFGNGAGDPNFCNKSFDSSPDPARPNSSCKDHQMTQFFGGILFQPETITVKDNTTGTFGIGRASLALTSEVASSIYGQVLPEIYCDFSGNPDPTVGFPVNCALISGIDEGDFYTALGIVGAGPIGSYAAQSASFSPFQLDNQPNHGWPNSLFGLRRSYGHTPAQDYDPDAGSEAFALSSGGAGPQLYEGVQDSNYNGTQAAGVAFVEIRRQDAKGLQVSSITDHQMQVSVRQGLGGYRWTGPGSNSFQTSGMNEPVWIMVNALLKALGLWGAPPAYVPNISDQEAIFDVISAVDVATNICDIIVPALIGGANVFTIETQFKYTGISAQQQSLSDWLIQIANTFLGMWTFAFGKLKIMARENACVGTAYTVGNVILGSASFKPAPFSFNRLNANYADEDFLFVNNSIEIYDEIHAAYFGSVFNPLFLPSDINYSGVSTKSQAARLITTRLREEICGYGDATRVDRYGNPSPTATFDYVKQVSFKTTALAIADEPGMIGSIELDQSPFFPAPISGNTCGGLSSSRPGYLKFRITSMALNEDYSMDVSGKGVHDDSYALSFGPKPADRQADPIPIAPEAAPQNWLFKAITDQKGNLHFRDIVVGTNNLTVTKGTFNIYYIDESKNFYGYALEGVPAADRSFFFFSGAPSNDLTIDITIGAIIVPTWVGAVNGITSSSSITDVLLSVAAWANAYGPFSALYSMTGGDTDEIFISDPNNTKKVATFTINPGGTLVVAASGPGSIHYAGSPPVEGEWIMIGDEIMLVVKVTPTVPNFGYAQVTRAQLGTVQSPHPRITTSVSAIDPNYAGKLTVAANLDLHPGNRFVAANTEQQMIGSYDPATGITYVANPFTSPPGTVYQDPRIWRVSVIQHIISFPIRFFRTIDRALFDDSFPLPNAGVVLVTGYLENVRGLKSTMLSAFPVSLTNLEVKLILPYRPTWPYRVRTLGNHRFVLQVTDLQKGSYIDLFPPIPAAEAQAFESALATVTKGSGMPIDTPSTVVSLSLGNLQPSGLITISGVVDDTAYIQVKVTGGNSVDARMWVASENGITDSSTASDVATSLAAWLNSTDDSFSTFYTATASANTVILQDNLAYGGTLATAVSGGVTAGCSGFTSVMGVKVGRRYAFAFFGGGNRSDISLLSQPIGPTGDALSINIQSLPVSSDSSVTKVEIYATPDGSDSPLRLIKTVNNGSIAYLDTLREAALGSLTKYPGVTQGNSSDDCTIIAKQNGNPWFTLYIPQNENVSNTLHGFALDPVTEDISINADVDDNIDNGNSSSSPVTSVGVDLFVELN